MLGFLYRFRRLVSPGRFAESNGSDRSMPYRPTRDPVVLLLAVIVIAAVMAMVTGIGVTLGGDSGSGPVFPFPESGENETLSISVNRTVLSPGDTVAVTVTWVGDGPVRNATVTTAGRRYRTGSDGTVVIAFEEPGTYEIAARLPGESETASTATIAEVQVRRTTTQSSLVASRTGSTANRPRTVSPFVSARTELRLAK